MSTERLPTGCRRLDEFLGGGLEPGVITQIFGGSGSGKTNIILQIAIQTVKDGRGVIFIDTEGFSVERFKQIAGEEDAKKIATKIVVFEPLDLEEQHVSIKEVSKIVGRNFGLVVVDSATALYRTALEIEDNRPARRALTSQLGELQEIARRHRIPVAVTNQVYMEVETGRQRPLGGMAMEHSSKTIIELEKAGPGRRRAKLVKHRSLPEDTVVDFDITASGLE